ncbi:MAG: DUF3450 domain-containing protein [Gammaproteobacteria bacterium]
METTKIFKSGTRLFLLGVLIGFGSQGLAADKVDRIVDTGVERNEAAKTSQARIDKIANSTDKLASKYKRELKVIDGLKVYNSLLQKQLDDQLAQIQTIKNSIDEVSIIQRQVTPLMVRMVDGLEQFIGLDVPFLLKERTHRIETLRETVARADVTAAEKFRSVFEAFQIEVEYGRTIEAYKDVLDIEGRSREVSLLRFGRISLVYQTEDGLNNGVWDQISHTWKPLDSAEYRNNISNGLKIARKQIAPELLMLPVNAAEDL